MPRLMLRCRLKYILFLLICLFMLNPQKMWAATNDVPAEQLITVLIPGLSLHDLPHCPTLLRLSREGAIGLLNTQNEGPRRISAAYLSMATGKKAVCTEEAARAWQSSEKVQELTAADFFQRYTGYTARAEYTGYIENTGQAEYPGYTGDPPPQYAESLPHKASAGTNTSPRTVYLPFLQLLQNCNPPEIRPGLLGETLERHKIPLLFIGNHDLPEKASRPGALLAMNEKGIISNGIVDRRTYTASPFSPTIYTTNYAYLYAEAERFLEKNEQGLVLLDLGDLVRLDTLATVISPTVYAESRQKLLTALDSFLALLQQLSNTRKLTLLIIAPYPAKEEITTGNTLTPVCYYRPNMPGNQLLLSASTKRNGLLTNLDIGPTILAHWRIASTSLFSGNPLTTVSCADPITYLNKQLTIFQVNHTQRPLLIKGYVLLLIILVLFILLLLLCGKNTARLYQILSTLLLTVTSIPLLLLLLPLFPSNHLAFRIIALLTGVAVVHWFLHRKYSILPHLTFLYLLTVLAISADLLLGAPLMKNSILGYDPISGARYYGIGNEYLGVLFGSFVVGLTLLLEIAKEKRGERLSKKLIPLLGICALFLIILVAAPQWGTNVGGAITFLISYLLLFAFLFRHKLSFRLLITAGVTTALFLLLLFAWDLHRPIEAQSHIGQTARLIKTEGAASLLPIFVRKISMNLKLIRYSLWSRVFLTFLAALALVLHKPPGLLQKLFGQYHYLQAGFYTGLIGSFIILAVNDSGIVAAGTSMLFIAPTLLYLVSHYPKPA